MADSREKSLWSGFGQSVRWLLIRWVIALALLAAILVSIDYAFLATSLAQLPARKLVSMVVLFVVVLWVADSLNLVVFLRRFLIVRPFSELLALRGFLYMAGIVNFALSIGAFTVYLRNRLGLGTRRSAELTAVFVYADFIAVALIPLIALSALEQEPLLPVRLICLAIVVSLFFPIACRVIPAMRKMCAKRRFLSLLLEITPPTWLTLVAMRVAYTAIFVLFPVLAMPLFGIHAPAIIVAAYFPVALIVGRIPITPAGLGTMQTALIYFFSDYGNPESVLAFSLSTIALFSLGRLPIGLWCLWRHSDVLVGSAKNISAP